MPNNVVGTLLMISSINCPDNGNRSIVNNKQFFLYFCNIFIKFNMYFKSSNVDITIYLKNKISK